MRGNTEVQCAAAAVHDRSGAHNPRPRCLGHVDCLARRLARGEHIFDHQDTIVCSERKAAPESERCASRSLGENCTDTERARHLVADD
jgi:hypothetical protein